MKRARSVCSILAAVALCAALSLQTIAGHAAAHDDLDAVLDQARKGTGADDFLPPEQAFRLSASAGPADGSSTAANVRLDWIIAPGYYLYRDRIKIIEDGGDIGAPVFPTGQIKADEYFGQQVVYHDELIVKAPLLHAAAVQPPLTLRVTYQGCAEAGLCYPPIMRTLGFELTAVAHGEATFTLEPGEHLYNPIGVVHGGVAATLLDSAMGCAVHTTLEAPTMCCSVPSGSSETHVTLGRRTATAEGRVTRGRDGKLLAHASTTCLIMS